ncbi:hypothetical protein pipiens_000839, partial [Culex pipiens pipiens]
SATAEQVERSFEGFALILKI